MADNAPRGTILVVEDDDKLRKLCVRVLESLEYSVTEASSAKDALASAKQQRFDLLLTDFMMPGMTGDDLVEELRKSQPDIVPIMMTAYPSTDLAVTSLRRGVYEFLTKPFAIDQLKQALERVTTRREEESRRFGRQFADALVDQLNQQGEDFDLYGSIQKLLHEPAPAVAPPAAGPRRSRSLLLVEPAPTNPNLLKTSPNYRDLRTLHAAMRVLNRHLQEEEHDVKLALTPRLGEMVKRLAQPGALCGLVFGPNLDGLGIGLVRLAVDVLAGRPVVVCGCEGLDEQRVADAGALWFGAADDDGVRTRWSELLARRVRPILGADPEPVSRPLEMASPDDTVRTLLGAVGATQAASLAEERDILRKALLSEAASTSLAPSTSCRTAAEAASVLGGETPGRLAAAQALAASSTGLPTSTSFDVDGLLRHQFVRAWCARLLAIDPSAPGSQGEKDLALLDLPEATVQGLGDLGLAARLELPDDFDAFKAGLLLHAGVLSARRRYAEGWFFALHRLETSQWTVAPTEALAAIAGLETWQATATAIGGWGLQGATHASLTRAPLTDEVAVPQALLVVAEAVAQTIVPFPGRIDISGSFRKEHLAQAQTDRLPNPMVRLHEAAQSAYRRRVHGARGESWTAARAVAESADDYLQAITRQTARLDDALAAVSLTGRDVCALALAAGEQLTETAERYITLTDAARRTSP